MLFVGCSNVYDYDTAKDGDPPPPKDKITWACSVMTEIPFYRRLFKTIDTLHEKSKLETVIEEILRNEKEVQLVEEP